MKICFKCNNKKPLTDFYKHKGMVDGRLNKCKECTKNETKKRDRELRKDPLFVVKEKERSKEKYHRLNYKEKQKVWDKNKPWKKTSTYKNLNKYFKIPKGIELHHWNYSNNKLKDIVLMATSKHRSFHQLIELDLEKRVFKVKETGVYLDTRDKHLKFITSSGFSYSEYSKDVIYRLKNKAV